MQIRSLSRSPTFGWIYELRSAFCTLDEFVCVKLQLMLRWNNLLTNEAGAPTLVTRNHEKHLITKINSSKSLTPYFLWSAKGLHYFILDSKFRKFGSLWPWMTWTFCFEWDLIQNHIYNKIAADFVTNGHFFTIFGHWNSDSSTNFEYFFKIFSTWIPYVYT